MADENNVADGSIDPGGALHGPDPHGQAALLLVESLIHGLIARSVISVAEAVEIVQVASEVKAEIGPDLGDSPAALRKSLDILGAIQKSLGIDLPPG